MSAQPDRRPLSVHPERVRRALDPRLNDPTIVRLMASQRLRGRIEAQLGLAPSATEEAQAVSAETHGWLLRDPAEAARRAGAVLHGQALRAVLSGPEVVELVEALGREAHALGLREGAASPPRENGGDLVGAIARDGHACLAAWLSAQPPGLRAMVLLTVPPGSPLESASDDGLGEQAAATMELVRRSYEPADGAPAHG